MPSREVSFRVNLRLKTLSSTRTIHLLLLAVAVGAAVEVGRPPHSANARVNMQVLASVGGQPDDITVDSSGRLVWGDLARGTVDRLGRGRVSVIASGLSVPEGVIALRNGVLIVAEQGLDRIVRIDNRSRLTVLHRLQPVAGQEGVDGIGRDPRSNSLLIPDSARGSLIRRDTKTGSIRVLARGLGRPVDAAGDAKGNVLVPDEHLGTLVVVTPRGRVSYRGSFATPDDVAIDRSGRVWVTSLGDGGLWLIGRRGSPQRIMTGLANPQGLTLDRCGDPIVVEQNTDRIVRVLLTAASRHCAF